MSDPVLWLGFVLLVGTVMALSARSLGLPSATGALVGGCALLWAVRVSFVADLPGVWGIPDGVTLVRHLLLAFLCLMLGAEIDLAFIMRQRLSILITALAQAAAVFGAVWLVGLAIGLERDLAFVLGGAAIASSPAAIASVCSETGARGDMAQRLMALSGVSVLVAMFVVPMVGALQGGPLAPMALPGLALLMGISFGVLLLVPVSRMETRGAILTCLGLGVLLLVLVTAPTGVMLVPMTILAGFLCGNLMANRQLVREALREIALPCAIAYYALAGAAWFEEPLWVGFMAAVAIVTARGFALFVAGIVTRGTAKGVRESAAMVPMMAATPALLAFTSGTGGGSWILSVLVLAGLVSEAAGMVATRWSLLRSGETTFDTGRADAWRQS